MNTANNFKDRSIKSGHKPEDSMLNLELLKDSVIKGVSRKQGDVIKVSRSEAKKLIALDKSVFKISLD